MAFTHITITQDYDLADGLDPVGEVSFTPTYPMTNGVRIPAAKVTRAIDEDGLLSIDLAANTDPDTLPTGTAYLVEEKIQGAVASYYVTIPHDAGSTVVLSDLAAVGVAPEIDFPAQVYTTVTVDGSFVPTYAIDSTPVGPEDLAGVSQANAPVGGVLVATAVTNAGAANADVTAWAVRTPALNAPAPNNQAGRYLHPVSPHGSSTSGGMTTGTLRLAPWVVPYPMTIDRIGGVVTVVGDAGSKLRLVIYSDNGFGYPGALLLDAGTINGDSATVQEITVSQVIPAGLYWVGGVIQVVTTTQPTIEITNQWTPPIPLLLSTSAPAAAATSIGYAQTGVTGAAPANFTTSVTPTGSTPRLRARLV